LKFEVGSLELSRHFERSGAESRNPFTPKHREERKIPHRLHGFSQIFQSADKLCSQASGLHRAAKRSCHAETAETAETPVISSAAERSREILSCRSIAKREKISHRLHGFSRIFQSNNKFCSQASGLHRAGRIEDENNCVPLSAG